MNGYTRGVIVVLWKRTNHNQSISATLQGFPWTGSTHKKRFGVKILNFVFGYNLFYFHKTYYTKLQFKCQPEILKFVEQIKFHLIFDLF